MILNRDLFRPNIVFSITRSLSSFSFVDRKWVLLEPVSLEGISSSSETVETVSVSFVESVIGTVEHQASIAIELSVGDLSERRGETVEVESFVAVVAENDVIGVAFRSTNLASLWRRGKSACFSSGAE